MNGYHVDPLRIQIKEVWADNLEEEFERIRDAVERYQYIAMDTEFPGIVARPTGNCMEYNYQTVKCNVDLLKVIQLGITFADSHGNLARGTSTWQFNFCFDLDRDMYAQDSIDFLKQSGIDFEQQQKKGISLQDFGELIMSSGLVMNEDVKWISFHGCYDFGYLLKLLTCAPLPLSEAQFFELLHDFFPALYDIKFLLNNVPNLNINGGQSLQKIADHLNVKRIGQQHQAGSDSLVTCRTFFKLMETYFDNQIDDSKFSGVIYGLGAAFVPKRNAAELLNYTLSNNSLQNESPENYFAHSSDFAPYSHASNNGFTSSPNTSPSLVPTSVFHPHLVMPPSTVPSATLAAPATTVPYMLQHNGNSVPASNGTVNSMAISHLPLQTSSQQPHQAPQLFPPTGLGRMMNAGASVHGHLLYSNASVTTEYNEHAFHKQQQQQQQQPLSAHLQETQWSSLNTEDCVNPNLLCGSNSSGYADRVLVFEGSTNRNPI